MNKIESECSQWNNMGFPAVVKDAPKDAVTFDKVMIVYSDENKKSIRRVSFFCTMTNQIVANF